MEIYANLETDHIATKLIALENQVENNVIFLVYVGCYLKFLAKCCKRHEIKLDSNDPFGYRDGRECSSSNVEPVCECNLMD